MERGARASYEFYFACLDRIDILITEKNANVTKDDIVKIIRTLAYFRPREYERQDKQRKEMGKLTKSELQDDIISVRHRELIEKNSSRSETLHENVFGFIYKNLSTGLLKDMFTQFDEEQESKLSKSLYDVMSIYI